MMPKVVTKRTKQRTNELRTLFEEMAKLPPEGPEVAILIDAVKRTLTTVHKDTKGVRLDLAATLPDGREFVFDFTGVDSTTKAAIKSLRSFVRANKLANDAASGVVINNAMARVPSPAVVAATKAKLDRYVYLMEILEAQFKSRVRQALPKLVPGIITHLGEIGPALIDFIEVLVAVAGKQFDPRDPMSMGMTKARFTARYRTKVKDELLAISALGFGRALECAGNPMSGWVLSPEDADGDLPDWEAIY
jgi:hypothetical protein